MKYKILNKDELAQWLFERAQILGHKCDSIKGPLEAIQPGDEPAELFNLAWVDSVTGESIHIIYGEGLGILFLPESFFAMHQSEL